MKDPIIYNNLRNNFSQISNYALLDISLSAKAYKLYAYMCYRIGLSSSWQFNKDEILKHFKEGEKAMRSAFKELIDAGFLERKRVRNNKGLFEKTDYIIYAEPINKVSNPQAQKRHVDKRHVDNPHVDNATLNNKDKNNKELTNKEFLSLSNEEKKERLKKIWEEKGYKSSYEKYFLFRGKNNWKGVSNLEIDCEWWEDGYKNLNNNGLNLSENEYKTENIGSDTLKEKKAPEVEEIEKRITHSIWKYCTDNNLIYNSTTAKDIGFVDNIELIDGNFYLENPVPKKWQWVCEEFNLKVKND